MLTLAVTTNAATHERMRDPLRDRGIDPRHLPATGRDVALTDPPPMDIEYDVGYVYPARLMEGGVLDERIDVPWVNGRDAVLASRNKARLLAAATDAGLDVPHSVLVSNPTETSRLYDVWDRFDGPVVVKPNSTTRGRGVARADDVDSFLGIVDYLDLVHDFRATGDKSFLVQSFVPGARDVRVMLVDGAYVGAVERKHPDGKDRWKHNVHRGAQARGITASPAVRAFAERVADLVPAGVLGVDLLVTDDRIVLSETNARPTIDDSSKYAAGFWDRVADVIRAKV